MPNFDDLFASQPVQQEDTPFDKDAWAARKQAKLRPFCVLKLQSSIGTVQMSLRFQPAGSWRICAKR